MNTYKVKKEDLIGQLKGFPIEVAQAMVDEQVRQGNRPDITVFQNNKEANCNDGGFYWINSKDGIPFWIDIIIDGNFKTFFEIYPKQHSEEPKFCNLYYNNVTMKFKTGEHKYNSEEEAHKNKKEDYIKGYIYFSTIECSIKE